MSNNTTSMPFRHGLSSHGKFINTVIVASAFSMIIVCLIGMVLNILSTIIFLQPTFRNVSINIFLAALSIADLLLCIFAIPVFAFAPLVSFFSPWKIGRYVFSFALIYVYPVTIMCHCCSIWLLVAVTIERWLAVCKPLQVQNYCTRNRAVTLTLLIAFSSVCYNFVRFWEYSLMPAKLHYMPFEKLRKKKAYILWYSAISNLLLIYSIPFLTTAYFNTKAAIQLVRCSNERRRLNAVQRDEHQTAVMLFFIVLFFLICFAPSCVLNAIDAINHSFLDTPLGKASSDVANLLVIIKSASTFVFYMKGSSRFRQAALTIFCCRPQHHRAVSTVNQVSVGHCYEMVNASPSVNISRRSFQDNSSQPSRSMSVVSSGTSPRSYRKGSQLTVNSDIEESSSLLNVRKDMQKWKSASLRLGTKPKKGASMRHKVLLMTCQSKAQSLDEGSTQLDIRQKAASFGNSSVFSTNQRKFGIPSISITASEDSV